jgi:hypothetical protein
MWMFLSTELQIGGSRRSEFSLDCRCVRALARAHHVIWRCVRRSCHLFVTNHIETVRLTHPTRILFLLYKSIRLVIRPEPLSGTQCRDAPWRVSTDVIFYFINDL